MAALVANTNKFIIPVAVPATLEEFTSFMIVYGNIAAPDTIPKIRLSHMLSAKLTGPYSTAISAASNTQPPIMMIGLRRPNRSEIQASNGQPITHQNRTSDALRTARS